MQGGRVRPLVRELNPTCFNTDQRPHVLQLKDLAQSYIFFLMAVYKKQKVTCTIKLVASPNDRELVHVVCPLGP